MRKIRNFNRSEKKLLDCIKRDPRNPQNFIKLGKLYFLHGDYPRATQTYICGLKLDPHNISLLFNLGVTKEAQNQVEQAKKQYLKILSLDAKNQPAQERLSQITAF